MKKVLVAYFTSTGTTEKMADYIAEGVRFNGHTAVVEKIEDIVTTTQIEGYDGYIFGSPSYSVDMPNPLSTFLALAKQAGLEGKLGGVFGPFSHELHIDMTLMPPL